MTAKESNIFVFSFIVAVMVTNILGNYTGIQLMPAILLVYGLFLFNLLLKRFGDTIHLMYKGIGVAVLSVFLIFVVILYLARFHFSSWGNETWFTTYSTFAIIAFIITYFAMLILSIVKTPKP